MSEHIETLADPTRPQDAVRLARERLGQGDLDGSERVVRFALDFNPTNPGLLSVLGDIAARRGQYPTAIQWIEKAIDAKPGDLQVRNQLVSLHIDRHDLSAAREALSQALEIAPADPALLRRMSDIAARQGDMVGAFEWADHFVTASPQDPASHAHLAGLHLSQSNFAAAETAQRGALELAPADPGVLRRMSDIAVRSGDMQTALEWADRAIAARPNQAASHIHLAWLHLIQGDLAASESALRVARELDPNDISLLRRLSDLATRRGDMALALDYAERIIAIQPFNPGGYDYLASIHLQRNDLPGARAALSSSLPLMSD
jgi:tetratricopeptide (TPR) repeat protein